MLIFLGLFAGVFTSISFIPQSIKTIKTKETESISLLTYVMYVFGVFMWILYGYHTRDMAVLLTNTVTIVPCMIILVLKIKSLNKK